MAGKVVKTNAQAGQKVTKGLVPFHAPIAVDALLLLFRFLTLTVHVIAL